MSIGLGKGVGIPVKLMHESEGHVITVSTYVYMVKSFLFCVLFSRKEGSPSEFSSLSLSLLFFFFSFSRREMLRKERKSEGRERDGSLWCWGYYFLPLLLLHWESVWGDAAPYKIARWPPFFFLLLLGWIEIRRTVPRDAGGSRGQLELSVDERVAHGARRCAFSLSFLFLFEEK